MRKAFIFSLLGLTLLATKGFGQTEKLKTVFIYNFTKHIEWPEASGISDFEIAVVGSSALTKELETLATSRKVKDLPLKISKYPSIKDAQGAQIVVIGSKETAQLASALDGNNCRNALIITEGDGLVKKGACISLVVQNDKLTFEISKSNIEARSLNVSSKLLALGINIQ